MKQFELLGERIKGNVREFDELSKSSNRLIAEGLSLSVPDK